MSVVLLESSSLLNAREKALLATFSAYTDKELIDPHQLCGLAHKMGVSTETPWVTQGLFVAESRKVIDAALDVHMEPLCVVCDERFIAENSDLVQMLDHAPTPICVWVGNTTQVSRVTGLAKTRGPIALFCRGRARSVDDVIAQATRIAVLENVGNYNNIGAIFRAALAFGVEGILVSPGCHDPLFRRAARESKGAVLRVPWASVNGEKGIPIDGVEGTPSGAEGVPIGSVDGTPSGAESAPTTSIKGAPSDVPSNTAEGAAPSPQTDALTAMERCIAYLKAQGFTTCAMALSDDSIALDDERLHAHTKIALVLGTEGEGLAPETIRACDYTVRIPMQHGVDSLNVAAASAVAFWELCRTIQPHS